MGGGAPALDRSDQGATARGVGVERLAGHDTGAGRREDMGEGDANLAQVGFVIADTYVVICRSIDKRNLSFGFGLLLEELACRADGAPKACETTTKNENMLLHGCALPIRDCFHETSRRRNSTSSSRSCSSRCEGPLMLRCHCPARNSE